ncbi:flagellar export chaperone FlgN [Marinitoga aeolica]|uniref:Flagellar export chaperone FlgN n=1 Tax=Marinitoga aeolica TaxID=2809031 RepID=A0ABY8PNL4_9BACT|nr:flagellar export chaperone FlgN [Marinitoga aeolica]WGS64234.1 flagellar export chaperone FlgN [Marinitoga aeolica]
MPDINIKSIIHEELNILVDLFYFMEKLRKGILNSDDVKSLNFVVSKISENALKLSRIEKQRIELFEKIAIESKIKNTLKDFIKYFSSVDNEFVDMLRELEKKLVEVSSLNNILKDLLKAKLEYNDILIKLFIEPKNNVPVYNKNGLYNKPIEQGKTNWRG